MDKNQIRALARETFGWSPSSGNQAMEAWIEMLVLFGERIVAAHNATQPEPKRILPSANQLSETFWSVAERRHKLCLAACQLATVEAVCKWLSEMNRYAGVSSATVPMACDMLIKDARARLDEAK